MEQSIVQSIERGFARERWEVHKDGCATSEDTYWKLDALQIFIHDLNWPEEEFSKYLQIRMKALTSEMINKCTNCTYQCFRFVHAACTKINGLYSAFGSVRHDQRNLLIEISSSKIAIDSGEYKYHSKLDETLDTMLKDMETCIEDKLLSVLEYVLSRLARYDEGNPIGAILSIAPRPTTIFNKMKNIVGEQGIVGNLTGSATSSPQNPKPIVSQPQNSGHHGHSYVTFMRICTEQLRQVVVDELWVNALFEHWYEDQMKMVNDWLTERLQQSLSQYQLTCLSFMVKKIYSDSELQGVDDERLNNKTYQSIMRRLQIEEANCALNDNASGHANTSISNHALIDNATQAVTNVSSLVEGASAKMFSLFK